MAKMGMTRKVTGAQRNEAIARILAGGISRTEAARLLNVKYGSVHAWLRCRGLLSNVPKSPSANRVSFALRRRLAQHLLAGEITFSEAALLAGVDKSTPRSWPETKGQKTAQCRDRYLRKLFPDLITGKAPPNNSLPNNSLPNNFIPNNSNAGS